LPYIWYGIKENNQSASLHVFPNPSDDAVSFIVPKEINSDYEVRIINKLGQTVFTKKYAFNEQNSINIKDFQQGIYFFQLYTENKTYFAKLNKL